MCLIEKWVHFHQMFIMKQSGSGVHVWELAFEHTQGILTETSHVLCLHTRTHNTLTITPAWLL